MAQPDYPIKLGRKFSDDIDAPVAVSKSIEVEKEREHFPSLFLEWEKKYDLPKSGTMVIKFKKDSETNTERNGKFEQRVTLDITEIVDVKTEKGDEEDEESAEDALDRIKDEIENESDDEESKEELDRVKEDAAKLDNTQL